MQKEKSKSPDRLSYLNLRFYTRNIIVLKLVLFSASNYSLVTKDCQKDHSLVINTTPKKAIHTIASFDQN